MSICRCAYEFETGFDDVRFRIQRDPGSGGEYPDWIIRPIVRETTVPGTNRTYIERLGFEPARVTWLLHFDCAHHFYALLEKYMTFGTLTVLHGFQSLKGAESFSHGVKYEHLDNVLLRDIDESPHFVGGYVESRVTFQRAVDPATRLAVVS